MLPSLAQVCADIFNRQLLTLTVITATGATETFHRRLPELYLDLFREIDAIERKFNEAVKKAGNIFEESNQARNAQATHIDNIEKEKREKLTRLKDAFRAFANKQEGAIQELENIFFRGMQDSIQITQRQCGAEADKLARRCKDDLLERFLEKNIKNSITAMMQMSCSVPDVSTAFKFSYQKLCSRVISENVLRTFAVREIQRLESEQKEKMAKEGAKPKKIPAVEEIVARTKTLLESYILEKMIEKIGASLHTMAIPGFDGNALEFLCSLSTEFSARDISLEEQGVIRAITPLVRQLQGAFHLKNVALHPSAPTPLARIPYYRQPAFREALDAYSSNSLQGGYAMYALQQYAGDAEQVSLDCAEYRLNSLVGSSAVSTGEQPCWWGRIRLGRDNPPREFKLYTGSTACFNSGDKAEAVPAAKPFGSNTTAAASIHSGALLQRTHTTRIDAPVIATPAYRTRPSLLTVMGKSARDAAQEGGAVLEKPRFITIIGKNGKKKTLCLYRTYNWLHRIAHSLHGPSVRGNLFLGTAACNARMQVIEKWIKVFRKRKADIFINVEVYYPNPDAKDLDGKDNYVSDPEGGRSIEIPHHVIYKVKQKGDENAAGIEFYLNPSDHRPLLDPEPQIIKALLIDALCKSNKKNEEALSDFTEDVAGVLNSSASGVVVANDANFSRVFGPNIELTALEEFIAIGQQALEELHTSAELTQRVVDSRILDTKGAATLADLRDNLIVETMHAALDVYQALLGAREILKTIFETDPSIEEARRMIQDLRVASRAALALVLENIRSIPEAVLTPDLKGLVLDLSLPKLDEEFPDEAIGKRMEMLGKFMDTRLSTKVFPTPSLNSGAKADSVSVDTYSEDSIEDELREEYFQILQGRENRQEALDTILGEYKEGVARRAVQTVGYSAPSSTYADISTGSIGSSQVASIFSAPGLPSSLPTVPVSTAYVGQALFEALKLAYEKAIADAFQESIDMAKMAKNIGPRKLAGWDLQDVDDDGNCFYYAIAHQLELLRHSFVNTIPGGTALHDVLRARVQGGHFKDREWADYEDILKLSKEIEVVVAIVDTRAPQNFMYHYVDREGRPNSTDDLTNLPSGMPIVKIAYNGNHYLSVTNHPELRNTVAAVHGAAPSAPFPTSSPLARPSRHSHSLLWSQGAQAVVHDNTAENGSMAKRQSIVGEKRTYDSDGDSAEERSDRKEDSPLDTLEADYEMEESEEEAAEEDGGKKVKKPARKKTVIGK